MIFSFKPQDLLHAEADTRSITASLTGAFLFRRLCQVVAVLFAEGTADLPVLPEVTCPAASWTVSVIADTVDHDRIVFHQSILLSDIVPQQILRK